MERLGVVPDVNHIFAIQMRGCTCWGWGWSELRCVLEQGVLQNQVCCFRWGRGALTCSGTLRGSSVPWQQGRQHGAHSACAAPTSIPALGPFFGILLVRDLVRVESGSVGWSGRSNKKQPAGTRQQQASYQGERLPRCTAILPVLFLPSP